jgi:diguanylate cyclase (GGDEF)-like protein/PAS domain S-box-containing protein
LVLNSFKGRVALAAALFAATGTAVVATLQFHFSEVGMKESIVSQQQLLTERMAIDTEEKLRLGQHALAQLAAAMPQAGVAAPQVLENYLAAQIGVRPLFRSIQVFDLKGHWVASVPDLNDMTRDTSVADREWFRQSVRDGGHIVVSSPLVSRLSGRPIVLLTFPLYDEVGMFKALLVGAIDLSGDHLFSGIADARIGESGHFVLLSRDGGIIMHRDRELITQPIQDLSEQSTPIAHALADPSLRHTFGATETGGQTLYTFQRLPSADWLLVGMQSYDAAVAGLQSLWRTMLFAGLMLSLLLVPLIWWLVSHMLQPLDALRRDFARLRRGESLDEPALAVGEVASELKEVRQEFGSMLQARRAAETALQREKEMMGVTLHSIGDAVIVTDAQSRITLMNAAAESITGWRGAEAVGEAFAQVFYVADENVRAEEDIATRAIRDKRIVKLPANTALRARNGREVPVDDSAAPILDSEGVVHGAVVVFRDVGVQRAAAREISWRATHDALTRLPNRGAFETTLEAAVVGLEEAAMHAVLMLDLDQFKIVNDTCGHAAGDELLKRLAALLQTRIRKSDVVARLGGDEFAVLMYHCPPEKAMQLAEELRRAVADMRFTWEDNVFRVGGSIGLVAVDRSYNSAVEVQKAADIACYMAKRSGRNRICVHSRDDHQLETMRHEMQAVSRIQLAIDQNRLRLYAQLITPVAKPNEEGEHFEVLVRLVDEGGSVIPPGAFLPAAERYGLMDELDRWVIASVAEACAKYFSADGWKGLNTVCINLSAKTLQDKGIGDFIVDTLSLHGVPLDRVCLEVTETAAIENLQMSRELIEMLRAKGLRFALDDFGVGMTSLAQLRDLPVDMLKIDGSFITGISQDRINSSMVLAIQNLARLMGMKTVAERVEHPEELVHLQALGVDYAQGYLFSIPMPVEELFGKARDDGGAVRAA